MGDPVKRQVAEVETPVVGESSAGSAGKERCVDQPLRLSVANPHFSTRHWAEIEPFQDDAMREYFVEGFPRAGLPG
jgi:hypothetical protein